MVSRDSHFNHQTWFITLEASKICHTHVYLCSWVLMIVFWVGNWHTEKHWSQCTTNFIRFITFVWFWAVFTDIYDSLKRKDLSLDIERLLDSLDLVQNSFQEKGTDIVDFFSNDQPDTYNFGHIVLFLHISTPHSHLQCQFRLPNPLTAMEYENNMITRLKLHEVPMNWKCVSIN